MQEVLVTGATGFIGRRLVSRLLERNLRVHALTRSHGKCERLWPAGSVQPIIGDLSRSSRLHLNLADIDTVFHLAGYAHSAGDDIRYDVDLHHVITVGGTRALLREAIAAKVSRFIFVSSVKAMGEGGPGCLDESSPPQPISDYGKAKLEAENLVLEAAQRHRFHATVVRLPLVYGDDNKGNLPRMVRAIQQNRFPPFPDIPNKRSMIHVGDVVTALLLAADSPIASGKSYIVTDGKVYSTRQIYLLICQALRRRPPSWSVPKSVLTTVAWLGDFLSHLRGRPFALNSDSLEKLTSSAWYNPDRIMRELGFRPSHSLESELPIIVSTLNGDVR